jgi:hypothetical protein
MAEGRAMRRIRLSAERQIASGPGFDSFNMNQPVQKTTPASMTDHEKILVPAQLSARLTAHNPGYWIAVFLLPLLVLWHRRDALFSPLWYTDPWFYLGHFRNLANFKRDIFPGNYYGSRLAWIVPGFLVHSVFSPLIANIILHLAVQLTATLSFFGTLRLTIGPRSAFLATMVFSVQPWLWAATGWDYPDGAGIAYFLLAMALYTRAALQPLRTWSILFAGMALAGMAYTHIFLATFTPLAPLFYIGLVWVWHRDDLTKLLRVVCVWTAAGFAIVTLTLCGINYLAEGRLWFYAPSVDRALSMAKDFYFVRSIWENHKLVPWLWPAIAGICTAALLLPARLRKTALRANPVGLLFSMQLLLAVAYMGYLQKRGTTVLGHHPYVSYLLPFAFLVMGASFWPAIETMTLRIYLLLCSGAAIIFAALWYQPYGFLTFSSLSAERIVSSVSAGALLLALLLRSRRAGPFLAVIGFAAFAAMTMAQMVGVGWATLHCTPDEYARVMAIRQRIEDRRKGSPIRFWFDKHEPPYHEYLALNSTYLAEFNRISESFPKGCDEQIDPRSLVVVTSQKQAAAEVARAALDNCWQSFGIQPRLESIETVVRKPDSYTISLLRIEPRSIRSSSEGDLFENVPLDRIKLAAPGAVVERGQTGVAVTTLPGAGAYAASAVLGLEPNQNAKFAVHVKLKVLRGKIGVGILNSGKNAFLLEIPAWPAPWESEVIVPLPSPPVIGDLIIRNLMINKSTSSAVVSKIEIWKLP